MSTSQQIEKELTIITPTTAHEYAKELARYIENASCAVSVLGELLEAVPEDALGEGRVESLGFLMKILGDGMLERSMAGYTYLTKAKEKEQATTTVQ